MRYHIGLVYILFSVSFSSYAESMISIQRPFRNTSAVSNETKLAEMAKGGEHEKNQKGDLPTVEASPSLAPHDEGHLERSNHRNR